MFYDVDNPRLPKNLPYVIVNSKEFVKSFDNGHGSFIR